jgi:quinol monooxygenase YgiN
MTLRLFVPVALVLVTVQAPRTVLAQNAPPASGPVVIMGQLTIKPDRVQEFLKIVQDMTARVKREDKGNIRYDLFNVMPLGNRGAAAAGTTGVNFVFLEEWESQAAFAGHSAWAGPIVQNQWRPLAEKVELVRLTKAPAP